MTAWEYHKMRGEGKMVHFAITEVEPPDDAPEVIAPKVFTEKRAAQIVREHNAYPELVEALRACLDEIEANIDVWKYDNQDAENEDEIEDWLVVLDIGDKALAKASDNKE